jgi:hypothetical protein
MGLFHPLLKDVQIDGVDKAVHKHVDNEFGHFISSFFNSIEEERYAILGFFDTEPSSTKHVCVEDLEMPHSGRPFFFTHFSNDLVEDVLGHPPINEEHNGQSTVDVREILFRAAHKVINAEVEVFLVGLEV